MKRYIGWVFTIVLVIALPSFSAFSDDSELFTNTANPDVLLVVDTSPSMNTIDPLASPAVPDLNGPDPADGIVRANQRFDIIWKVLYSLLNYDGSSPGDTPTFSGTLKNSTVVGAIRIEVSATYYNQFPSSSAAGNKVIIGSGTTVELRDYDYKTTSFGPRYWIYLTQTLARSHSAGEKFDFYTSYFTSPYPLTNTLAEDSSYINNIDNNDMASLKLRLGLMTYTSSGSSSPSGYGGIIENQQKGTIFSPASPNGPPFSPTYRDLWNSVISTSGQHGVWDKASSTPTTLALTYDVPLYFTRAYDTNAVCRKKYVVLITDGEDTRGQGNEGTNTNPRYYYPGFADERGTIASCGTSPNNYPADQYSGCYKPPATPPAYSTVPPPSGSSTNVFFPNAWESWDTGRPGGQVQRHNWLIAQGKALKDAGVELFVVGVGLSGTQRNAATGPKTAQPMNVALRHVLRRVAQQANVPVTATELYNIGTGYGGAVEDNTVSIVLNPVTGKPVEHAFFATSADDLSQAIAKILRSITSGKYSFTSPTVATVRTTDKNYLYTAYFEPGVSPDTLWPGHIYSRTLYDNGAINPTVLWDAAAPDNVSLSIPVSSSASSRRIFCGLPDTSATPPWKRGYFSTGSSSWGDSGVTAADLGVASGADNVIAWVRGAYFDNNVKLGDIYHSKPILVSNPSKNYFDQGFPAFAAAKEFRPRVLYVGANDGMLHAFLAGTYNGSTKTWSNGTGEELFGFIPNTILNNVQKMVVTDDSDHSYFVDSSPRVADVWWDTNGNNAKEASEWRTILIGGMRKGGEGYYALDVTDPPTGGVYTNFPKVLWEYSDTSLLAESWSEPFIGKVKIRDSGGVSRDRFVAIFGAGPNVGGGGIGKAVVVLDVRNGQVLRTFTGMDNGVAASPTAILDASGYIRFAYVVDINGNLWKFDFRTIGNATSSTRDTSWTATKLFTPAAGGQPAYHRVEVAYTSTDGSSRYLFYGTGDQEKPVSNPYSGKFYAIKDTDTTTTTVTETSSTLLDVTSAIDNVAGGTVTTQSGWVVKLGNVTQSYDGYTHSGEKVLSDPVVFYGKVYFTTYTTNLSNLCGGGIARVYGLDYQTGGAGMIADATISGETSGGRTKVPYHVFGTSGLASSPSLSINPSGQSSIFVGFSASQTPIEIKIESPSQTKTLKSWKEMF
jgi:Neisseria PilC beta-propeller domain